MMDRRNIVLSLVLICFAFYVEDVLLADLVKVPIKTVAANITNAISLAKVNNTNTNDTGTITPVIQPPNFVVTNENLSATFDCQNISSAIQIMDNDNCCFGPVIFTETLFYQCQFNESDRVDWFYDDPSSNECVTDCMFNMTNIQLNGTIDKDQLLNQTLTSYTGDVSLWKDIVKSGIDYCTNSTMLNVTTQSELRCNKDPYLIVNCLYTQMLKSCPVNQFINTTECQTFKAFASQCDMIPSNEIIVFDD